MTRSRLIALVLPALLAVLATSAFAESAPVVVASGLDRPRGLTVAPDGTLYAALVGHGGRPCNGEGCFGASGKVVRVTPDGTVTPVVTGLLSMRGRGDGFFSIGADQLTVLPSGRLATAMTAEFNGNAPKPPKAVPKALRPQVGHVITFAPGGPLKIGVNASAPEFARDPDGEGKVSNPYGITHIGNVIYVSDSAANDLLEIRKGHARVLATFPHTGDGQSVPDALAAGPDGALYVGEFTGGGSDPGMARIWRVVPGQKRQLFARGLSNITALAFGPDGSLYATEFGPSGAVVRLAPDGTRTTLADGMLHYPGGVAVTPDGTVYVSDWSVAGAKPATSGFLKGKTGQIVRLS